MPKLILVFLTLAAAFTGIITGQNDNNNNNSPRVYIEESDSWEVESDPIFGGVDKKGRVTIGGGAAKGGAKPRTAETIKRFSQQCKGVIVTMYKEKADFVVMLEHEGGKDLFNKDNKLAVFNKEGDLIVSGSFSRPRKAVDVACNAINEEFREQNQTSQNIQ